MAPNEMPRPPYFLVFEEVVPGAQPLAITVDERGAVPLFDSNEGALAFLKSTDFGEGWEPIEVSGMGLLAVLDGLRGRVSYVALNPPPARAGGGMRVEMGGLEELISALEEARGEDDLFGLLGGGGPG